MLQGVQLGLPYVDPPPEQEAKSRHELVANILADFVKAEIHAMIEHAHRSLGQLGRDDYRERQVTRSMPPFEVFMAQAAQLLR